MNWGKAIVLILIIFVLFICGLGYRMFTAPADDYDHQYYEDGLTFDHDYNREQQVTKDHAQPQVDVSDSQIAFTFPQNINGTVKFMRPSSDAKDATFTLDSRAGNAIVIATQNMAKGAWQLIFSWKSSGKNYLYQQEVYIK